MYTTPRNVPSSGIPAPGRSVSGIPTPGRYRSTSSSANTAGVDSDSEYASRTFAEAIKANDPAQHRAVSAGAISLNVSPTREVVSLPSGRRSVTGRPVSVTSSVSTGQTRAKQPRPASRQPDAVMKSASRSSRSFEEGDIVRIESLGYEGTLRYVGEINGKPGLWAGVELSGGFVGKGKNDGSVNGRSYFSCPPNCGVFVAITKLSAPTLPSQYRPPSVASSRSGRITPYSGRVTPSNPFAGRITPNVTPSSRTKPRVSGAIKASSARTPSKSDNESRVSSDSRASKYAGLTAKQLRINNSSASGFGTPERNVRSPSSPSPSRWPGVFDSHDHSLDSPSNTPRAPSTSRVSFPSGSRPSMNTSRPRVPSSVAMPPPPSPGRTSTTDVSETDSLPSKDLFFSSSDLAASNLALQNKINSLLSSSSANTSNDAHAMGSRSSSVASLRASSTTDDYLIQAHNDALARISELEMEVANLKDASITPDRHLDLQNVFSEREDALAKLTNLEKELSASQQVSIELESRVQMLERAAQISVSEMNRIKVEYESRITDLQNQVVAGEALSKSLKEAIAEKEDAEHQHNSSVDAKNSEIEALETHIQKLTLELDQERKELNGQVEELRQAGQETIALYEERLSIADTQKYELEDRITFLEDQIKKAAVPLSPREILQRVTSAAEIDNEALREQVQHLQKRISSLEDALEDAQAFAEREEAATNEHMKRYREKEEGMRNELDESRKAIDDVIKAEEVAKARVEEVEEALRESTLALENARAEIEILRSDVAAVNVATRDQHNTEEGDSEKSSHGEAARLQAEVGLLQSCLQEAGNANARAAEILDSGNEDDWRVRYEEEHHAVLSLQKSLNEQLSELESLRKKLNRDRPISTGDNSTLPSPTASQNDPAEIMGFKHIVLDLQKENAVLGQRNKLLESENRLLMSETDQLRQELKALEENIEQNLLREEALSSSHSSRPGELQGAPDTPMFQIERDMHELRQRLVDAEMKNERISKNFNKEVSELEALIESKIYREEELEQEVERLNAELGRSKGSKGSPASSAPLRSSVAPSAMGLSSVPKKSDSQEVCEICERPGHDIFTCDLLGEGTMPQGNGLIGGQTPKNPSDSSDLFCEDCESHGHVAADCPHSMDVF